MLIVRMFPSWNGTGSSSFSSSDRLIQLLHSGFHTKQEHFTLSSAPGQHFFTTLKSHKVLLTGHWTTMASFVIQFS